MAETKEHVLTHPFSQIIYKMHLILLVARTMMENGADSDRTSQYIMRTAAYMGIPAENVSCHIAYTTIMLNIKDEERTYTRFSKCRTHRVNMLVLSAVSRMIWRAMRGAWSLELFEREMEALEKRKSPYSGFLTALGAGFACAGSCALFGCDLAAFFLTALCAFLGFYARRFCNEHGFNVYAGIAIAAFTATLAAVLLQDLDLSATPMLPIVACTLFIVPGVPLINAANDLLNHFITSGMTRAFDTLLIVCSTAFGMAIALRLGHVSSFTTVSLSPGEIYLDLQRAAPPAMGRLHGWHHHDPSQKHLYVRTWHEPGGRHLPRLRLRRRSRALRHPLVSHAKHRADDPFRYSFDSRRSSLPLLLHTLKHQRGQHPPPARGS